MVKWQTRTFEGRMPQGVRVQVPPRALLVHLVSSDLPLSPGPPARLHDAPRPWWRRGVGVFSPFYCASPGFKAAVLRIRRSAGRKPLDF